jgi:hypothetical protein
MPYGISPLKLKNFEEVGWMVTQKLIFDHLGRLDLFGYTASLLDKDDDGDYIKAVFPDLKFDLIKNRLIASKYYRNFTDTLDADAFSIYLYDDIEGYRTYYRMGVRRENFGTSITILVKRVDYYDSFGNYIPSLGFGMLKELQQKDTEDVEVFDLIGSV